MMGRKRGVVLFSGGQDSTTVLYKAIEDLGPENVLALSVLYGQRHALEIRAARDIAKLACIRHRVIDISGVFRGFSSALIDRQAKIKGQGGYYDEVAGEGLPTSYVPARNLIMLSAAASIAIDDGATVIYSGVCETDYSGYPDCRLSFIDAMAEVINLGAPSGSGPFEICTPLMFLTKAQSVKLAMELPGCMEALALSHTCYEGTYPGCADCPACVLRIHGFVEAGVEDPLFDEEKRQSARKKAGIVR